MNWVMLNATEMACSRFDRLAEALEVETRDDRFRVFGHLCAWHCRWAADPEFDHGLFWSLTDKRMGVWADWGDPGKFGRALKTAGYVADLKDIYPAELLAGRCGLVAMAAGGMAMLDVSWQGVHRRRGAQAHELFLFLLNRRVRCGWAREYGLSDHAASVPPGWLDGPSGTSTPEGEAPDAVAPGFEAQDAGAVSPVRGPGGGLGSGPGGGVGSAIGGGDGGAPRRAPPPRAVGRTGKETEEIKPTRQEPTEGNHSNPAAPEGARRGTGRPKTAEMRDFIRANKYDNPMACLRYVDESDGAMILWRDIVRMDVHFVAQALAEMVETDQAWMVIESPAAVLWRKCLRRKRELRSSRTGGPKS